MLPVFSIKGLTRGLSPLLLLLLLFVTPAFAQEPYFVRVSVDNPTPFVGQQVVYTVRFYAETLPANDYLEPRFNGWWRGELITTKNAELIDGRQYSVAIYETLLYPLQAGDIIIEPTEIVIPETVFSERLSFTTESVSLRVQPLPANAPEGFEGAVGRFNAEIEVDKETVMLGEPLTLRYRVSGMGSIAQIGAPSLALPENWRSYPNPATTSIETRGTGERTFEWRLVPETAGTHEFPPNTFAYFDPQLADYQTITIPPFLVDVLPSPDGQRELPTFRRGANAPAALAIKPVIDSDSPTSVHPLLWLMPPFGVLILWGGLQFGVRRKAYNAQMRQKEALKMARNRLQAARKLRPLEAYGRIQEAIEIYFADKLNHTEKRLSFGEIMVQHPTLNGEAVRDSYRRAEEGRYAPPGVIDVNALVVETLDSLTLLDKSWT